MSEEVGVIDNSAPSPPYRGLESFPDLPVRIHVELGRTRIPIRHFLAWHEGSVLELAVSEGEYVTVYANGKLISRGEIIVVEGNVAVRITEIVSS